MGHVHSPRGTARNATVRVPATIIHQATNECGKTASQDGMLHDGRAIAPTIERSRRSRDHAWRSAVLVADDLDAPLGDTSANGDRQQLSSHANRSPREAIQRALVRGNDRRIGRRDTVGVSVPDRDPEARS